MKQKLIMFLLIPCGALLALDADFGVGVRRDNLRRSIGMYPDNPNILSELKWENIYSLDAFAAASSRVYKNIEVNAFINVGKIVSGSVWDRDYLGNNRTEMFSESHSKSDEGSVFDAEASLSTTVPLGNGLLTEVLGYGYHNLFLSMIDGWQIEPFKENVRKPLTALDSTYEAQFYGPFLGLNYRFPIKMVLTRLGYTFSFLKYKGEGYWNLRTDFANNFTHNSDKGFGHSFFLNVQIPVDNNFSGGLAFIGRYFKVYNGEDHVYTKIFGGVCHGVQKLNDVYWSDLSLYIYINYRFDFGPKRLGTRDRLNHILNTKDFS